MRATILCALLCGIVGLVVGADDFTLTPEFDFDHFRVLEYKTSNTLKCNVTGNIKTGGISVEWLKEDMPIDKKDKKYQVVNNRLTIHRTTDDDIVTYTCVLKKESGNYIVRKDIKTLGKPTVKITSQETYTQGEKITVECLATGKPTPTISWAFGNETFTTSTGRIKLLENDKKHPNAILQIEHSEMSDRGTYVCTASNKASVKMNITIQTSIYVRVKDKLAALWPFIGICIEVLVLCIIIFAYERKKNKSEMEESDTDISPELKSASDGREDVRHRK